MSRNNDLEMSNFESLGLGTDFPSQMVYQASNAQENIAPTRSGSVATVSDTNCSSHDVIPQHVLERAEVSADETLIFRSKVVCSNSKASVIRHFSCYHLPAILVTSTLLALYIAQVQWNHPTIEQLNALQFAAKVHEALILVSLSDILLHRICYGLLIADDGIPLGFISSAFHLGSPIQYLISRQLWTAIPYPTSKCRRHGITGFMIILVALLCLAASPLSAIIMIPRQGWWKSGLDSEDYYHQTTYFHGKRYDTNLDSPLYGTTHHQDYEWVEGIYSAPSQDAMLQNLGRVIHNAPKMGITTKVPFVNITYTINDARSRPISLTSDENLAITSCPMSQVSHWLSIPAIRGLDFNPSEEWLFKVESIAINSSKPKKWKQPLLAVECSGAFLERDIATFDFNYIPFNQTLRLNSKEYPGLMDLAKEARNSLGIGPVGYRFLNVRDAMNLPISTDILFASVANETYGENGVIQPLHSLRLRLDLCFISAYWVEAATWGEPSKSFNMLSHFDFPVEDILGNIQNSFNTHDFIQIQDGWMTNIGNVPNTLSNRSSYQEILHYCNTSTGSHPLCLSITLALHITDAIAETGPSPQALTDIGPEKNDLDPEKDVFLHITIYIYTYAYEFGNSHSILFAFAILLFHILITLVHLVTILLSRYKWHGSSWGSFGQLLVLALSSKAPNGLGNVDGEAGSLGGEVGSSQIWTKATMIRVVGKQGKLQILLGDIEGVREQLPGANQ